MAKLKEWFGSVQKAREERRDYLLRTMLTSIKVEPGARYIFLFSKNAISKGLADRFIAGMEKHLGIKEACCLRINGNPEDALRVLEIKYAATD